MSSNIRRPHPLPGDSLEAKPIRPRKTIGERLTRNVAVATLLLAAVVGLRASPQAGGILQAVQQAVESEWDQNVGKLTYVSSTLGESIQVFGRSEAGSGLYSPVTIEAAQAWSQTAPCLVYDAPGAVFAAGKGEITQIAHDDNGLYIVRIYHENSLESLYYGLNSCDVQEGDAVSASTVLGQSGASFAFEVRRNGKPVDCGTLLPRNTLP